MGAIKGLFIGLANTIVIAVAIALSGVGMPQIQDDDLEVVRGGAPIEIFVLVMLYGLIPGLLTGAITGFVAGLLKLRPGVRIAILLVPAIGLVVLLGRAFDFDELILLACIPTAASVLLLERLTRPAAPGLPAARAV